MVSSGRYVVAAASDRWRDTMTSSAESAIEKQQHSSIGSRTIQTSSKGRFVIATGWKCPLRWKYQDVTFEVWETIRRNGSDRSNGSNRSKGCSVRSNVLTIFPSLGFSCRIEVVCDISARRCAIVCHSGVAGWDELAVLCGRCYLSNDAAPGRGENIPVAHLQVRPIRAILQ